MRAIQRQARIHRALDHARRLLAETRPDDYTSDRYYQAVHTTRERKVRQLERLLAESDEGGTMPETTTEIPERTCQRCGYTWQPLVPEPRVCPSCKNHRWREPARRRGAIQPVRQEANHVPHA